MIGHHTIWDIYQCNSSSISFVEDVKILLNELVLLLDLQKISEAYKQFEPYGATGFILLEESHISIHTWPEHQYAAIDIFSCKSFDMEKLTLKIKELLNTNTIECKLVERGTNVVLNPKEV
jgi:S-adenosylmethionine decarboxylase